MCKHKLRHYRVVEKQQILNFKNVQVKNRCGKGNHRSKKARISGCYLALNTLLGLNELKYAILPIKEMFLLMNLAPFERPLACNQPRQSNFLLAYQQCSALVIHDIH